MESIITFLNTTGKSFVGFSSSMLIQSSVIIILLLVINVFLRKRIRVVFLYGIWMLVLVKLVLPTTFSSPTALVYWMGDKAPAFITEVASIPEKIASFIQRIKPVTETTSYGTEIFIRPLTGISPGPVADISAEFTVEATPAIVHLSWQGFALLAWLTVVTAMLLLLIRRLFFIRVLLAKSKSPSESMVDTLQRCRKQMAVHRPVFLRLCRVAAGPSVCGLFRPTIIIPKNLLHRLKREDLRSILLHELAHIKRGDLWISLIQTILQIVYFYNPLLWVANVIIRKVREQAVDEMVLVAMGEKAEDYPQILLNISRMTFSRPALNLRLIGVSESKKALERRIMNMLNKPVPKSSKLGHLGLIAIVVIGSVILPMDYNPTEPTALAASAEEGRNIGGIIVPGVRVGQFTFDMTEDDVLEKLGKPKAIFYGDQKYTLDNLPRKYFMHFGDVSFHIVDDSVKGITALSPDYKFANGVRVGDSERKIKKAFGNNFRIKETKWKDFLSYRDKGLMFEINKQDRTVMEINVSPIKSSKPYKKAVGAENIIIPGLRVGEYTFNMTKDDILESLGKPKAIFYGDEKYTLDNLPRKYFMHFGDVSFHIVNDSVKGITALSPSYKLPDGLRVGDSERKIKKAFGKDFRIEESRWKDFLSYKDEGLMFEINKKNRTVMEINVSPVPGSESYKKAKIPATSHINEQGRVVDKLDYPFVDDPQLIGTWKSVDFVGEIAEFKAGEKQWGDGEGDLYLKGLIFKPNGKTFKPWWTWTKGLVFHSGDKTASKYTIKHIEGSTYMFYEWKSGDYTIRYMKPLYYVLKKVSSKTSGPLDKVWISEQEDDEDEIMGDDKTHIPATSYINEKGRIVDKTDYPFVNDPKVIGGWKTVDFVREIKQFNPARKSWEGKLWLNHLIFEEGGNIARNNLTWTKDLVLSDDTASKYIIREIDGSTYMFFEWKSGDYTIRHRKPAYYVLKKVLVESLKYEPMFGKKAAIPPTSYINEQGRVVDKTDYPFVNDPKVIGGWKSVDFVREIKQFNPADNNWKGDLHLNHLIFEEGGNISRSDLTWTKGLVLSDDTASRYIIREIDGSTYMFYEWKSGDYTIRYMKPAYYVLKKVSSEAVKHEPMYGKKADIPPTSTINEQGHIVDKIDYPFVNDPQVVGTWKSVDYVGEMEQFKAGEQQWKGRGGELFFNEMIFEKNGRLTCKNDKVPNGYSRTWTKGLVISDNDTKTASKYTIKEIDGSTYIFYEWKSGDYTFRHMKPTYYVLKKV